MQHNRLYANRFFIKTLKANKKLCQYFERPIKIVETKAFIKDRRQPKAVELFFTICFSYDNPHVHQFHPPDIQ